MKYSFKYILLLFIFTFALYTLVNGQIFPDTLKTTFIANLKLKDSLEIYITRENCFSAGYEKFILKKKFENYYLTAFIPIYAFDIKVNRAQLNTVLPDTLHFKLLNTYELTDTNIVALSQIEMLGEKCGQHNRGAGQAIGNYKIIYNGKIKKFSNTCPLSLNYEVQII